MYKEIGAVIEDRPFNNCYAQKRAMMIGKSDEVVGIEIGLPSLDGSGEEITVWREG